MSAAKPRIFPLGENALVVEFGRDLSASLNGSSIALAEYLDNHPFEGYIESAPAYSSVAVFYDCAQIRRSFADDVPAFERVRDAIEPKLAAIDQTAPPEGRHIEIPVSFSPEDGLDLALIAENARLDRMEVIDIFTSASYRVFMLGFLPGFAYMGEVDNRITIPRKGSPRPRTPKGSIGIAGSQTGIYPFESPGGWQIIGRTEQEMFDPDTDELCWLRPGDIVRFIPA